MSSGVLTVEFVYGVELSRPFEYEELIERVLRAAAVHESVSGEVVVSIVDNERIRELNREYRGKDSSTDVLSFPLEERGEDEPDIFFDETSSMEEAEHALGDIVISLPTAMDQAAEYGHSVEREVAFLSLHGFLHLLGYDHLTEEDEGVMTGRQREILEEVGLPRL